MIQVFLIIYFIIIKICFKIIIIKFIYYIYTL
jgi:hypothetical protein